MGDFKKNKLFSATGILMKKNAFLVLVKTEWNASVVNELEAGCINELKKHSVKKIITLVVPGAFEIPFTIKSYWLNAPRKKRPDAFIALGCLIRGETSHFDYLCQGVTEGIMQLNLFLPVPTIFGVLTVENEEQAKARIGGRHGHKGEEAALAALKMINPQPLKGSKEKEAVK